jgi:hypothetical protein
MGILEWATSPSGQRVPIHVAWFLIYVALMVGLVFLVVHAIYVRYFADRKLVEIVAIWYGARGDEPPL